MSKYYEKIEDSVRIRPPMVWDMMIAFVYVIKNNFPPALAQTFVLPDLFFFMNDKEKLEAIKKIVDIYDMIELDYTSLGEDVKKIKKILES